MRGIASILVIMQPPLPDGVIVITKDSPQLSLFRRLIKKWTTTFETDVTRQKDSFQIIRIFYVENNIRQNKFQMSCPLKLRLRARYKVHEQLQIWECVCVPTCRAYGCGVCRLLFDFWSSRIPGLLFEFWWYRIPGFYSFLLSISVLCACCSDFDRGYSLVLKIIHYRPAGPTCWTVRTTGCPP